MMSSRSSSSIGVCQPQSVAREVDRQLQRHSGGYNPLSPDFFWHTAFSFASPMATTTSPEVVKVTSQPTLSQSTILTATTTTKKRYPRSRQNRTRGDRSGDKTPTVSAKVRAPPPANPWGANFFSNIKEDDKVLRDQAVEAAEKVSTFRPEMTQTWKVGGGKKVVEVFGKIADMDK